MTPFNLPESLAEHTVEQLEELRVAALAEFQATFAITPRTPDTLSRLEALADAMQSIRTERESREAIDASAQALAEQVGAATPLAATGPADDADEDAPEIPAGEEVSADDSPGDEPTNQQIVAEVDKDDDEAPEPMADDAPTDSTASASPATPPDPVPVDPVTDPAPTPDPTPVDTTPVPATDAPISTDTTIPSTPTHAQEPVPVAASASTPSAGTPSATALNAHRDPGSDPADPTPPTPLLPTIVASANLPHVSAGVEMSMDEMADAFVSRIRSFPKNNRSGQMRSPVANIVKPFSDDLRIADGEKTLEAMERAVAQANLPGGSLVAAGGWCAPSETIYDLCVLESTDGMLSLPAVQVSRGGIRHTTGPDFRTIYDGTGFTFTEAQDEAGEYAAGGTVGDKPCAVVPCPDFTDDRLEVAGVCITSGILQDVAYPEMTRRFIEGALIAHGHRVNSLVIADLEAGSDAVSPTAFGSATTSLLSAIELVSEDIRYRNRMSRTATLELVLPFWARGVARADLSNRLGVELLSVSNSQIDAWMRERMVAPQYVYDWQDDMVDGGSGFGSAVAQTAWPTTLDFLIYPAGTWVKGEQDVITVDAIYDSVNLPQNNFTAIFTEEGWMTMKRCHDSRIVTVTGWNCFGDTASGTACA